MKKIGIVADNWKVPAFKAALDAAGFKYDSAPFTADSTAIRVDCDADAEIGRLHRLCVDTQKALGRAKAEEN